MQMILPGVFGVWFLAFLASASLRLKFKVISKLVELRGNFRVWVLKLLRERYKAYCRSLLRVFICLLWK